MTSKSFCFSPVSGGFFIAQAAQIAKLLEARDGVQFDAYFGASGGNIASMISIAFTETSESILKIVSRVKPSFFISPFLQGKFSDFDSLVLGLASYEGLKKPGKGSDKFFEEIFEKSAFNKLPEVWTLIYNKTNAQGEITCTRSKDQTLFKDYIKENNLQRLGCGEVHYLDSDSALIAQVTMASASIPGVKNSVKIWDNDYVDGGISAASPGTFFCEPIKKMMNDNPSDKIHYFYIASVDLANNNARHKFVSDEKNFYMEGANKHWLIESFFKVKEMIVSMILSDKRNLLENWLRIIDKHVSDIKEVRYSCITTPKLRQILADYDDKHYFIESVSDESSVSILSFDSEDLKEQFNIARDTMSIIILYVDN